MKTYRLTLTLEDDLVLSQRNSTTGGHSSLAYIPGSALRGWAASRLYAAFGGDAFLAFHSGAIRFGDARPAGPQGQASFPVPLAWHTDKGSADKLPHHAGRWLANNVFNLAAIADLDGLQGQIKQPRALARDHLTLDGAHVASQRHVRTMTAIDDDGGVAEGQLFSYQSLVRGQRFVGHLTMDDNVSDTLADRVNQVFDGQIRLGRSKSTGYGRVNSQVGPRLETPTTASVQADVLHLWLLSDACLRDGHGQPTLRPDGDVLGLPGAVLDMSRSFLRSRKVSAWNAHRKLPELERQVLEAGSVVTLVRQGGFPAAELQRLAERGIGTGRAIGMGEVAVHPGLLLALHPQFDTHGGQAHASTVHASPAAPARQAIVQASPLLDYLRARSVGSAHADHASRFVTQSLDELVKRWRAIRQYEALPPKVPMGPGRSQWGLVGKLASRHTTLAEFRPALLPAEPPGGARANTLPGLVRRNDEHWDAHAAHTAANTAAQIATNSEGGSQRRSLRDWLADTIDTLANDALFASDIDRLDAWQRLCADAGRLDLHVGMAALDRAPSEIKRLPGPKTSEAA